jgi:hypothetical protein
MGAIVIPPSTFQALIDDQRTNRLEHQREMRKAGKKHPADCGYCGNVRKQITSLLRQKRDAESAEARRLAYEAAGQTPPGEEQPGFLSRMATAVRAEETQADYARAPVDAAAIPAPTDRTLYKTIDVDSGDPVFVVQLVVQAHRGAKGKELLDQFEEACRANGWDILAGQTEEKKQ